MQRVNRWMQAVAGLLAIFRPADGAGWGDDANELCDSLAQLLNYIDNQLSNWVYSEVISLAQANLIRVRIRPIRRHVMVPEDDDVQQAKDLCQVMDDLIKILQVGLSD